MTGQSVSDVSQNVMANLGWDDVRLPNPIGFKQDGTPVITFRRTVMVYRRGHGPQLPEVSSS